MDGDLNSTQQKSASKIFEGYKALGLVARDKPFIVRYVERLQDVRIVVPVGLYFHTYNSKLQLLETSHAHPQPITAITADSKHVFTSAGKTVYGWRHGHRWLSHQFTDHKANVHSLLNFGPHIISVDEENVVRVTEIATGDIYLELPFGESFTISCLLHPSTYLNKILFGSREGPLQLWNLRTQKLIHTFKGWNVPVTSLQQAPSVDIVAIGLQDGLIIIHNIKFDETLLKFFQDWGPVVQITFRTDGPPHMATSSDKGNVAIWDLEKGSLKCQKREIHKNAICGLQYINGEPLMITSSADNSIKIFVFDDTDDVGRQLYVREGHSKCPTYIRFYGPEDNQILSVAPDSTFRCFSVWSERLNRSFGQASFNKKYARKVGASVDPNIMPPIVEFASETIRENEWDNAVARHKNLGLVTTWTTKKGKMGSHTFLHKRFKEKTDIVATAIALSSCGNFVIIGYNTGHIDRYNVQSAIHRLAYGKVKAHEYAVRGIVCDEISSILISGDHNGVVNFWAFKTGILLKSLKLDASIDKFYLKKETSLLAIALSDDTIRIIDIDTRKIARSFPSHCARITDLTISYHSKWLIVASEDKSIRTWDLPNSKCIDWFKMPSVCTSLSMSPNGEYLAMSLENELGIFVFTNLSIFYPISLRPLSNEYIPQINHLPSIRKDEDIEKCDENFDEDELEENQDAIIENNDVEMEDVTYKSPEQIASHLITLSSLPTSRWKNLFNIDLIKMRNKPKEPIEKPKSAPFFLPTLEGLVPDFDMEYPRIDLNLYKKGDREARINLSTQISTSPLGRSLLDFENRNNYLPVIDLLMQMNPNEIDSQIRSLDVEKHYTIPYRFLLREDHCEYPLLRSFLECMKVSLETLKNYELINSYLAVFLKVHANTILNDVKLTKACRELASLSNTFVELRDIFDESLFMINFISGVV